MKNWCLIFLVMAQVLVFGAEGKDVIRKIRSNYQDLKSFESDMNYAIYRGFDSTEPVEEYTGYFCRSGENSYRRIHESEFLNFPAEGLFLQVDHRDRSMYLAKSVQENMFDTDLEKSLKMCGNIIVSHSGNSLIVSLILSKAHDLPYSRIDLNVSEDYWIQSMTLFYASKANFSKTFNQPDMDRVRMEIKYIGFNKTWHDTEGKLEAGNYVKLTGEKIETAPLYKNYSVTDFR